MFVSVTVMPPIENGTCPSRQISDVAPITRSGIFPQGFEKPALQRYGVVNEKVQKNKQMVPSESV